MIQLIALLLLSFPPPDSPSSPTGAIEGSVVNGSQGDAPVADAVVTLRADHNGSLEPIAQTTTDAKGHFAFEGLTLDPELVLLPGADRDGIHYPGKRLRLTALGPRVTVAIRTFDAISNPSPLEALRHDIDIRVEKKAWLISECLLIANPSIRAFIGAPSQEQLPITLALSIPPNFDRVTFNSEFYGRRFRIVDHRPVTDIPWPPGQRELKFTYRIPFEESGGEFRRPLDVPARHVRLRFHGDAAKKVSCNLSPPKMLDGTFEFNADHPLAASFVVETQIGSAPIPWASYGRWGAVSILGVLVLGTLAVTRRQMKKPPGPTNRAVQGARSAPKVNKSKRAA